jgi:DNA-dependent metalloprotease WSS1
MYIRNMINHFMDYWRKLGSGHTWYKPSLAVTAADRRSIKNAAERRAAGVIVGPNGRKLGDNGGGEGRRLGGVNIEEISPKQLAAMAAEQRARDQKRCGAKHGGADMRRETERAQREGTTTQAQDIGKVIDLNDLQNYDLEDIPIDPPAMSGFTTPPTSTINNHILSDWNCQQCTFLNPPMYLSCQVCRTERKLDPSTNGIIDLTEEFGVSWECQACTFANENNTDGKCIICGTEI